MNKETELTEFIRNAIRESGKTATELSAMTGMSAIGIRKILSGETKRLQAKTVAALIKALGIPAAEIEKFYS